MDRARVVLDDCDDQSHYDPHHVKHHSKDQIAVDVLQSATRAFLHGEEEIKGPYGEKDTERELYHDDKHC